MKCLIVSKTRKGRQACVGAIAVRTGESLRLFESDGSYPPENTPYQIGQIWNLDCVPDKGRRPPHSETVIVVRRTRLKTIPPNELVEYLQDQIGIKVWVYSPDDLFDGYPSSTFAGKGYVSEITGLPLVSTGFWISDKDLILVKDDQNSDCYEYRGASRIRLLKYVGFQTPIAVIPAGTLIRVSLATWWRPRDWVDGEDRCYLQLSGWYI